MAERATVIRYFVEPDKDHRHWYVKEVLWDDDAGEKTGDTVATFFTKAAADNSAMIRTDLIGPVDVG